MGQPLEVGTVSGLLSRLPGLGEQGKVEGRSLRPHVTARGGLGTIADVIAVLSALGAGWSLLFGPLPQVVLAIALTCLALAFMALSFKLQRQQAEAIEEEKQKLEREKRRSRHAESWSSIADSATVLKDATAMLGVRQHPSLFCHPAKLAAVKIADAMTAATGNKCRVVIKTVYAPPGGREDVAVKTFVTSETPEPRRADESKVDWIKENTDFDEIFYQNRDFFWSNDLAKEVSKGYKNSHFTRQVLNSGDLPYLSTLVWAIVGPDQANSYDVKGFLCVDTKHAESFDVEHDSVVGMVLAPLWYLALERYEDALEFCAGAERAISQEAPEASI